MQKEFSYFNYLKNRSRLGLYYRNYWLYPILNRHLKGKTLDLGCGIGDFLSFRKDIIGVDINIEMVNWCHSNGHQVKKMNFDKLPFENKSFDSIIMDNVLEHIENPEAILSEVHRTLNHKGIFLLGVPGTLGYKKDSDHKVFYSKDKLISTIESNGFKKLKVFSMPLNLSFLEHFLSQYCVYGVFSRIEINRSI